MKIYLRLLLAIDDCHIEALYAIDMPYCPQIGSMIHVPSVDEDYEDWSMEVTNMSWFAIEQRCEADCRLLEGHEGITVAQCREWLKKSGWSVVWEGVIDA